MLKLSVITATVAMAQVPNSFTSEYNCILGPDESGEYREAIVAAGIAHHCGAYCTC